MKVRMRNKILIYVLLGIGSPGLAQWTASLKTARMLEKGGNVEGAIAVYEDILNKNEVPEKQESLLATELSNNSFIHFPYNFTFSKLFFSI